MSLATYSVLAPDLLRLCDETAENAERLIRRAIVAVRAKVSAGDALSSALYQSTLSPGQTMPMNAGPLSAAEVKDIFDWINDGAKNN